MSGSVSRSFYMPHSAHKIDWLHVGNPAYNSTPRCEVLCQPYRIHRIHRRQHAFTDDTGMSKHRLSLYNAYYHNWHTLNFTTSDSSSDDRCFLKVLIRGAPDPELLDPAGSGSVPDLDMLDPAGSGSKPDPKALDPAGSGSKPDPKALDPAGTGSGSRFQHDYLLKISSSYQ